MKILSVMFAMALFSGPAINAQNVGIGTATPHASAALEIKNSNPGVTNKGFLMPVMSTANRTTIATPAKGLLVYDSTAASFFYYDGLAWKSFKMGKLLADDDGNTMVEVERTTNDNIVRIRTGGSDHTWLMRNSTNAYNLIHYPVVPTDNFLIGTNAGWKLKAGIGGNVFMGVQAGLNDSTGTNNTLIGNNAGQGIYTGSKNIAIGNNAGLYLKDGSNNVNIGLDAGWGSKNNTNSIHIGFLSGFYDSLTTNNIGIGNSSLYANQGNNNIGIGQNSLMNTTTSGNIAIGVGTLFANTSGKNLIAIGDSAMYQTMTANVFFPPYNNIGIGSKALYANKGTQNLAIGTESLYKNIDGNYNTAIGYLSMTNNQSGAFNTSIGENSLRNNNSGSSNTIIGYSAGAGNTFGRNNVALGIEAMYTNGTGYNNTLIGSKADVGFSFLNNASAIGANAIVNTSDAMVLGNNVKVGIGTSSPSGSLNVNKVPTATEIASFNGTTYPSVFGSGTTEDTYIRGGKAGSRVHINDVANTTTQIGWPALPATSSSLRVNGSVSYSVRYVNDNYTLTDNDHILYCDLENDKNRLITVNLPSPTSAREGRVYTILVLNAPKHAWLYEIQSNEGCVNVTGTHGDSPIFDPHNPGWGINEHKLFYAEYSFIGHTDYRWWRTCLSYICVSGKWLKLSDNGMMDSDDI